jgi:hypothetical protein
MQGIVSNYSNYSKIIRIALKNSNIDVERINTTQKKNRLNMLTSTLTIKGY